MTEDRVRLNAVGMFDIGVNLLPCVSISLLVIYS